MQNGTQSVRRALALLRAFGRDAPALGVTELAARVGLHKSTAHRLAATLAGEGFLRRDAATGRYSLGEGLYRVAAAFVEHDPLLREGRTVLQELGAACGHMVSLGVLDGDGVLFVLVLEATLPVRAAAMQAGDRLPLSVSAAGKVLLASLPPGEAGRSCAAARCRGSRRRAPSRASGCCASSRACGGRAPAGAARNPRSAWSPSRHRCVRARGRWRR
ncbi:MAG: helix-turn-helix domain-containing protein [Burkholderiales bacterium]|nr:helix-turn-helix domain-containing protein [Burkholderiales bacterium]